MFALRRLLGVPGADHGAGRRGACLAGALLCILVSFFLLRDLALDLPYLGSPLTARLHQVSFYDDPVSDSSIQYYLEGTGEGGETYTFRLETEAYEEGKGLLKQNSGLNARVSYLPHTDVVTAVEFLPA